MSDASREGRVIVDANGRQWICRELARDGADNRVRVVCVADHRALELWLPADWSDFSDADLAVVIQGAEHRNRARGG
jgi:hypothetical protein